MASRKMLLASQGADVDHQGDLSSMIDMVFLLLIFFMVTASFVKLPLDPRVQVPVAGNSREDNDYKGRIILNIFNDEAAEELGYRWAAASADDGLGSQAEITEYIASEISALDSGVAAKLHVRADELVEMRHVTEAIAAALRGNEVFSVVIATYPN